MSTNAYRYMSEAELLKSYKRIVKKAERELVHGYHRNANQLYETAQSIAREIDRRKEQS